MFYFNYAIIRIIIVIFIHNIITVIITLFDLNRGYDLTFGGVLKKIVSQLKIWLCLRNNNALG